MARQTVKVVHCRYPKCTKLHETTELSIDDAIKGGSKNSYYHPDCWHTMQTVNKIRDTFVKEVNPMLTGPQIGQLVSIVNNMIFNKGIDVDYILFAIQWFIKYKPGSLRYPGGIAYIVQDRDVETAWKKEREHRIRAEMQSAVEQLGEMLNEEAELNFGTQDTTYVYKPQNKSKFSNVLGV